LSLSWFVAAATGMAGTASAHDIWLTHGGSGQRRRVIVNYGHPNDRPPTAADKMLDLVRSRARGKVSLLDGLARAP